MPSLRQLKISKFSCSARQINDLPRGNGSDRKYEPLSIAYKKNLSRDTEKFSLTNPLFSIRSTILSFLLTIFFCYLFLDPSGVCPNNKTPSHFCMLLLAF